MRNKNARTVNNIWTGIFYGIAALVVAAISVI